MIRVLHESKAARQPAVKWPAHLDWLALHVDEMNAPELAAALSERVGFEVKPHSVVRAMTLNNIKRSPEAARRLCGNRSKAGEA